MFDLEHMRAPGRYSREQIGSQLEELTLDDVNRALQQHIKPSNLYYTAVTPSAKPLFQQLTEDIKTPIVYDSEEISDEQQRLDAEVAKKDLQINQTHAKIVDMNGLFQ